MLERVFDKIAETWYGVSRGGAPLSGGGRGEPHIRDSADIKRYMASVMFALLPALVGGTAVFGSRVLLILLVSYLSGGAVELAFSVVRRRPVEEGFLVTGMVFALTLPPGIPLWTAAAGIAFGTFFGKELFGGTGRNVFNPALVGRLFITISFPALFSGAFDALSGPTPLTAWAYGTPWSIRELLFAGAPGACGETSRLLLIAGGLWLAWTRISDWRIPLSFLGGAALFTWLLGLLLPGSAPPPLYALLSGGLVLGAFFMATDPVTSPVTAGGTWLYGLLCAFFTVLFRAFSSYPEGVMFAIVLSNAFAPFLDEFVFALRFPAGFRRGDGAP